MSCGAGAAVSVADILRDHVGEMYLDRDQARAAAHILSCRTPRLGGHVSVCNRCGSQQFAYHSCRDRHCPRCGGLDQALWAEAQLVHLLPVTYFHVVFTVPGYLRPFFTRHPDATRRGLALNALFAAVAETLLETAATQGIRIGILAVLHTWTQRLTNHPHIHCLVPGGGLTPDGWAHRRTFLIPLKVLRPVFKGKLLGKLEALLHDDKACVGKALGHQMLRDAARQKKWNIDIRRPFAGPEQVVQYFARYTRRIAISDRRLIAYDGETVTFRARDPKRRKGHVPVSLSGLTFTKRYLQHVLPHRFVRIRRYGILSNRVRRTALASCRESLHADPPQLFAPPGETRAAACVRIFKSDPERCPVCEGGKLSLLFEWGPRSRTALRFSANPRGP